MDFIVGTWSFCYDAIKQGEEMFRNQTNCMDTIEKTINCMYIKFDALQITTMHARVYFHFTGPLFSFSHYTTGTEKPAVNRISSVQILNSLDLYTGACGLD